MKVIDTHAHFWNVEKFDYPWIEKGSVFDRNFLLEDYQDASSNIAIEKIVFVECNCTPGDSWKEVNWVREYARMDPRIRGIVAHVPLTDAANVDARLERMAAIPLIKGIRHNIQWNEPGFATNEVFIQGVKKVHQKGLHFELCLTHDQMDETLELVRRCPEVRFVLDHCAKPGIKSGSKEPWMTQMRQMAQFENVTCKISGLVTEADWAAWKAEEVLFYCKYAAEVFGISRIMFGSDWPVCTVAGGLEKWYALTQKMTWHWTTSEREDFYFNNGERVYELAQAPD